MTNVFNLLTLFCCGDKKSDCVCESTAWLIIIMILIGIIISMFHYIDCKKEFNDKEKNYEKDANHQIKIDINATINKNDNK